MCNHKWEIMKFSICFENKAEKKEWYTEMSLLPRELKLGSLKLMLILFLENAGVFHRKFISLSKLIPKLSFL